MKVQELIAKLQRMDPEQHIMILDGFNGGGVPREINLGPSIGVTRTITQAMQDECADCEEHCIGSEVYVMGFGFY